jgi:Uncharacterized flavoproteins
MNSPLSAIKLTDRVYWVGAIDHEIRDFHGYSTPLGSTYNAYLILGEKPILIDTVKEKFFPELMARISSVIDPQKISYLISNHSELDHSGALPATIAQIKPEKVFASKAGITTLKEHFGKDLDLTEIPINQKFTLGNANFTCIETKMLHWPESMFTYFLDEKILFSQDAFGMHLATHQLFADTHDRALLHHEAKKYFANILLPYAGLVTKLITALLSLNLEINLLATAHGPLWRQAEDIFWIIDLWKKWAAQTPQDKIIVCYSTMWGSTTKLATAIADGASLASNIVKVMPIKTIHRSDIATELLGAKSLIVGSPTINGQILPEVADLLCYLKGLKFKVPFGQAFGSFGWSGEAVPRLKQELTEMKIDLVGDAPPVKYVPDQETLINYRRLGQELGQYKYSQ